MIDILDLCMKEPKLKVIKPTIQQIVFKTTKKELKNKPNIDKSDLWIFVKQESVKILQKINIVLNEDIESIIEDTFNDTWQNFCKK